MKIIAVIPAYNEEKNIGRAVEEVRQYVDEVIVIDDGSCDKTPFYAKEAGALVYSHFLNRGQGAALETGKRIALSRGADVIVTYDADGQFEAKEINEMIRPILDGEADVVLGARFLKSKVPLSKKIFLKGAIILTRLTSGLNLSDTHNGFRALSREAAQKIEIQYDRMAHASEILDKISKYKLRYKEIPVTLKYLPEHIKKGQKLPDYLKILFDLFVGRILK